MAWPGTPTTGKLKPGSSDSLTSLMPRHCVGIVGKYREGVWSRWKGSSQCVGWAVGFHSPRRGEWWQVLAGAWGGLETVGVGHGDPGGAWSGSWHSSQWQELACPLGQCRVSYWGSQGKRGRLFQRQNC